MQFEIGTLTNQVFHSETGLHASEHPHLYFSWMQIKLTYKLNMEMEEMNKRLSVLEQQTKKG
jgi:hypothetical protein